MVIRLLANREDIVASLDINRELKKLGRRSTQNFILAGVSLTLYLMAYDNHDFRSTDTSAFGIAMYVAAFTFLTIAFTQLGLREYFREGLRDKIEAQSRKTRPTP
jgi:di/tricarboxylate transporter